MTSLLLLCLHFLLIFQFSHDALKLSPCIILFSPANLACFSCILLVQSLLLQFFSLLTILTIYYFQIVSLLQKFLYTTLYVVFLSLTYLMCTNHPLRPSKVIRFPWNWRYRQLLATIRMLGLESGSSRRAASALTAEPNLQPFIANFKLVMYYPVAKLTCSVLDSCLTIFILFHVSNSFSHTKL